ncbi:Trehalase family protein, partial [Aphelenchoides avenae]
MRQWALDLNNIWRSLCRQVDKKVLSNPERHSLIYVPEPFVVPGGRFREFYYWDAYWIIRGLLASGMTETSKRIIKNFLYMVDKYGMIPNGGRIYYVRRSQPPLLAGMLYEYYEATRDKAFVAEALPLVEKELQFWEANRQVVVQVDGLNYTVFQYRAASNAP